MREDQSFLEQLQLVGGDVDAGEVAEAGIDAVDGDLAGLDLGDHLPRGLDAPTGFIAEGALAAASDDPGQFLEG